MEVCPISNQYTNGFPNAEWEQRKWQSDWREYYPLRYYMERGLDVSINTDNRQLHSATTLTDDYMCAARMVGGLTQWEVLRIVKAGFKNAFLGKDEIGVLLDEVEDEIYGIVAGTGLDRRASPGVTDASAVAGRANA
jgi:adenosine deaminase